MAFKLIEAPKPAGNAPQLVALVRAGARFERGILIEGDDHAGADEAAIRAA